eukprot:TRINITY_DN10278_c0_g3_i1.p1 TRINITY_DN10278_c0_g3~~TRINITY_DN10278_c0_g3_i1.p1  ORF type:complete len:350 (+),score=27.60 TRINITY_DN10278_c0_g3_i1:60-1052(+)
MLSRQLGQSITSQSTQLGSLPLKYTFKLCRQICRMSLANKRKKVFRPLIDNVERLSKGDGAKKRGTGSRIVPHRLNVDERKMFELAKKNEYLQLKGTGYRKERKGSPLANIWRQWCDAKALPCVFITQIPGRKIVMVDLSTLRRRDCAVAIRPLLVNFVTQQLKGIQVDNDTVAQYMPFTIIDVEVDKWYTNNDTCQEQSSLDMERQNEIKSKISAQQKQVHDQAQKVRQLKEVDGLNNQDPLVQQQVKILLELKEVLQDLQTEPLNNQQKATPTLSLQDLALQSQEDEDDYNHPMYTCAIWQIPAYLVGFQGEELSERQMAEAITQWAK